MAASSGLPSGVGAALDAQSGTGQRSVGMSISTFMASLATAIIIFVVEFLLFLVLKGKLTRIYQPRTYLVPERERTEPSPPGLFRWIIPVFKTSNSEFIQKCGLDAYFFLRYLRMLLKIFIPLSLLILPVLIPLNKVGGKGTSPMGSHNGTRFNVTGLDELAWGNVRPENADRYWGHLILAVIVVVYVCAVFFDELRGYVRLRQAYLTSPQHRLRASATTVLVTSIPEKWLSVEALDGLFDVFPGGVRNIWLNRNLDQLSEKIKLRNKLALMLESAETELIKKCKKAQLKQAKKEAKKAGRYTKADIQKEKEAADQRASQLVGSAGVSAGNPQETPHSVQDILHVKHDVDPGLQTTDRQGHLRVPSVGKTRNSVGSDVTEVNATVHGEATKIGGGGKEQQMPAENPGSKQSNDPDNRADCQSASSPSISEQVHRGNLPQEIGEHLSEEDTRESSAHEEGNAASLSPDVAVGRSSSRGPTGLRKKGQSCMATNFDRHGDEHPLTTESPVTTDFTESNEKPNENSKGVRDESWGAWFKRLLRDEPAFEQYPAAFNENYNDDDYGEPMWKKYIKPKDRETMRLPIFGWSWMPSLPLLGKKVDTIDYCRRELARLNLEIEIDQQHPERFPLMNSAFVQFNHQVAAHMACQCVSHHLPKQMAPRMVEISPNDVIWDNMSIRWWERYLRTFGVIVIVSAMVIGWAFPVAFTGLLSQLSYLEGNFSWLRWLSKLPEWLLSAVQGILPPLFLAVLMALLPLMLRFLTRNQGVHTGMAIELTVQNYYFAFLFVQIFLVVSISSSFSTIFSSIKDVTSVPSLLAQNIPKASNYFFSYMILQAMSVSAGALVQIFGLISWFILAPIFDNTARMKWARTTNLNQMQWGTFFPVYTALGSIGLIYCVIAPLIMIFNVLTFSLFWFVYRYNTLYVTKFQFDTGGLLFPRAINQLFTGIYVMEVCLIGMFFLVRDEKGAVACEGQAVCMIIVFILTILFQYLLNEAFNPLFRYLPITLEDEASRRDEEFARAQRRRLGLEDEDDDDKEQTDGREHGAKFIKDEIELSELDDKRKSSASRQEPTGLRVPGQNGSKHTSWADRSMNRRSAYFNGKPDNSFPAIQKLQQKLAEDAESQGTNTRALGHALFSGINDELEDLTPDERDRLVQRAFQHEALRARRPVIWIPRDDLGVSDDEIFRTQRFSKHIWISNEYQALDGKCRAIFSRSPPDFSEVDLIQL
ncbi:hypothetical protein VTO42DRAFT_8645 [Malbranchea cinnamomea]